MHEDSLREKCGIIAISNNKDSVYDTMLGLNSLQHRGHEAFGIACSVDHKRQIKKFYGKGVVANNIRSADIKGRNTIGHVRYSTSGGLNFAQPICAKLFDGEIAMAHNGNLVNSIEIRENLIDQGCVFQSDVDTEILIHLIAKAEGSTLLNKIVAALKQIRGAYSLVILFNDTIFAIRDPLGIRPLVLGKKGSSYIAASETCAIDALNASFVQDVKPGEIIEIIEDKIVSHFPFKKEDKSRFCIFEYIYFARADSVLDGKSVYEMRKSIGRQLALESVHETDMVVPVLDSGIVHAIAYSKETKIPLEIGIIKNNYAGGRTFIEPTQENRYLKVKLKHNANKSLLAGKRITLIDDSIVRGTTLKQLVRMLKEESGVKEIHVKIASPKMLNSCYYGVDTPDRSKLIAANNSTEEIRNLFDVDSIYFLSLNGLHHAIHGSDNNVYCDACFSGKYPIQI